jgi:hypothetical protein
MIGFRSDGRLSGNMVVDLVEHVIIRYVFSTTSDKLIELLMTGIPGSSIKEI